jgi:hypothetical protein
MLTLAIIILVCLVCAACVVAVKIRNASQDALYDVASEDDSTDAPDFMIGMDSKILAKTGNIKAIPFNPSIHLDVEIPHVKLYERKTDLQTTSAPRQIKIGQACEKSTVMISREIILDDVVYSQDDEDKLNSLCSIRQANGRFRAPNLAEQQERDALIEKKQAWRNGVKIR